ncbi:MAG: transglutaminase domain-containing protein [Ruminococcus sp.]|nr:transglutaminase domain-containing protein [Ruminococcus sp.]
MKKKNLITNNGITICDSIVMSVKNKRPNFRKAEAIFIAVLGFVSVLMSFFGMFDFNYDRFKVAAAAVLFSIGYITLILMNKKSAFWVMASSLIVFGLAAFKFMNKITDGFKFVYNIIYRDSFHTDINYYKYLKPAMEEESVTILFIFAIWLISFIIYFFTIYRPNPILPLLVTFPILEVGLYNGIEIPIFWGIMTIAYWLALLAMSSIDIGEYSGGTSGFVRKDNLFFPKRQMKLKVTEKCGMFIMSTILIITVLTVSVVSITNYKRSDELNKKRKDISEAFNEFTLEDLAASISRITSAFGFTIKYENNKLGNNDHVKYKDVTDLEVTVDHKHNAAIYLKDNTGCRYDDNEWLDLKDSAYDEDIFDDFSSTGMFPQDFPCMFGKLLKPDAQELQITIDSKVKKDRTFSTYGIDNIGGLSYNRDKQATSINQEEKKFSYKFMPIDIDFTASSLGDETRNVYSVSGISDEHWRDMIADFCEKNNAYNYDDYFTVDHEIIVDSDLMYSNPYMIMAQLLESKYKDFVYDNYLQIPDNKDMDEVYAAYSDILSKAKGAHSAVDKVAVLDELRLRMQEDTKYTLSPGKTPSNRDFINYFLIENKKGYCIHYATSGVILARMAGIPARYATGYVITADDFNDGNLQEDGSYAIDVQDNRSHAWVEIYLDGYGWVPFEFTAGYSCRAVKAAPTPVTPADPNGSTEPVETPTTIQTQTSLVPIPLTTTKNNTTVTVNTTKSHGGAVGKMGSDDNKKGGGFTIPKWVKVIIFISVLLIITAAVIILRRMLIINNRKKEIETGSSSDRIGNMYDYTEKLLENLRLSNEEHNYMDFAKRVEQHIGGTFIEQGSFESFMKLALHCRFGKKSPDTEELKECEKMVSELSQKIYDNSGFFKKLWIKFVDALV